MRKILIVFLVLNVLLLSTAALAYHRPITRRISGDPDEFQGQRIHDESGITMPPHTGDGKATLRGVRGAENRRSLRRQKPRGPIHILWENLLLGKMTYR